jgi:hypothetical protein
VKLEIVNDEVPSVVTGAVICGRAEATVTRKLAASMASQKRKGDRIISHLGGKKSITTRFKDCPIVCKVFSHCVAPLFSSFDVNRLPHASAICEVLETP